MEQWKSTLQQRHAIAAYRDATDLAVQVAADLSRSISGLDEATRARDNARAGSTVSILDELTSLISKAKKSGVTEAALLSSLRRSMSSLIADTQRSSATVFFSYSQQDREIVQKIAAGLSQAGVDVWLGGAEFQAGMSWVEALERALDTATFVAFFIFKNSIQSVWVQRGLEVALQRQVSGPHGAILLPILLEQADVPPLLRHIQWVDLTDGNVARATEQLVQVIGYHTGSQASEASLKMRLAEYLSAKFESPRRGMN